MGAQQGAGADRQNRQPQHGGDNAPRIMSISLCFPRCVGHWSLAAGRLRLRPTADPADSADPADPAVAGVPEWRLELRAVREQVLLQAPQFTLCREDCRGPCPTCGKDLNEGACECVPEAAPGPWDALKNVKFD